jgi:protein phosphatase
MNQRNQDTVDQDTVDHIRGDDFADAFFAAAHVSVPMIFGAASHTGNVRTRNDDHFAIFQRRRILEVIKANVSPEDLSIPETYSYGLVVADGMGGVKAGELASRMAIQAMMDLSSQATSWVMKFTDFDALQFQQRVQAYVQRIHTTIEEHGQANPLSRNMGTTWTSAHLLGFHAIIVHLGDSRAYLFRDGELSQITYDETMAQRLIDAGMEPDSVHKFRHILLNSLGGGNENVRATIHHLELNACDQLLLCTDGLNHMVPDSDIAAELRRNSSPQDACDALVQLALNNGGKDNVTVVLARPATS